MQVLARGRIGFPEEEYLKIDREETTGQLVVRSSRGWKALWRSLRYEHGRK